MSGPAAKPSPIEDYAMIGDLGTAALVSREGSIDWLCWPRFDSDACMAALLGTSEHGRWQIAPKETGARITRRYRPDTLILETRFETDEGAVTLIDFMPARRGNSHIIRILKGERGSLTFCTELVVRCGYGAIVPWVTRIDPQTLRIVAGPDMVVLRTQVKVRGENLKTVGEVTVNAGDEVPFVLSYAGSHEALPEECDARECLAATEEGWRDWAQRNKIDGRYKEAVTRSLITLKALTYLPTGGMVAAPTTSLPESIGGARNWDYRFCWLRDATLTLLALMNAGYYDEAHKWRDWLLRAAAGTPQQIQIMYGLRGERRLTEWEVPWLPGYGESKPVRIGNAAHNQRQIDVFGEVMDALHQARAGGLGTNEAGWDLQQEILKHVERVWPRRDEGIWEVRSGREHFTYSKTMAWVAFDRAIKSAEMYKLPGPLAHWRRIRDEIHQDVCTRGFDAEMNSFVRAYGSKELDASLLLLPAIGFLPPDDPRILGTVEAIERDLIVDGLVVRYDTEKSEDGIAGGEGVFIACSFWLVDAYLMLGRRKEAEALFEKLLALRNDVGLLSEEYAPVSQRLVGNFPQAFSHLALVNTASNLAHGEKPAEQRAEVKVNGKEKTKV
ncbi:MAG: glycoside hydrolase family 15 protein [Pseudolabrys sp.]